MFRLEILIISAKLYFAHVNQENQRVQNYDRRDPGTRILWHSTLGLSQVYKGEKDDTKQ